MSSTLARALLREIPLAKLEVYLQVLDSGVLKDRPSELADNGDWCGAGCDAKGGACGAWCAFPQRPEEIWGSFDQHGHIGITKEDFQAAIVNPTAIRRALSEELQAAAGAIEKAEAPRLGPKVDAKIFIRRGGPIPGGGG